MLGNCLQKRLNDFGQREQGVTLIEFALILPIMIVLFIGLVEFTEAFTVTRKLSNTASTVSDLVSQEPTVNTAALNDIEEIAAQLMQPYSETPLTLVIVSVVADANNVTTVDWSYPAGSHATGSAYSLPEAGLTEPNSSLIVAEASYDFTPTIGNFLGSFTINERAFFKPRFSLSVEKTD
jgi:Flp pilus assembly protein TadG